MAKDLKILREAVKEKTKQDNLLKLAMLKNVDDVLNKRDSDTPTMITYEELQTIKVGERISLNENIEFEKFYEDENKMSFYTYMFDGGSWGIHKHNCYERLKVLKGLCIEKQRGLIPISEGEEIIYAPNEVHAPYTRCDSTYEVTFYKVLK